MLYEIGIVSILIFETHRQLISILNTTGVENSLFVLVYWLTVIVNNNIITETDLLSFMSDLNKKTVKIASLFLYVIVTT